MNQPDETTAATLFHPAAFAGKVIGITGGANGLGLAGVRLLSGLGAHVFTVDNDREACRKVGAMLESAPAEGFAVEADLAVRGVVSDAIGKAVARWGRLDGWVNNAAINQPQPFGSESDELFDLMFAVNVRAAREGAVAAKPWLARTRGSMVNVSSIMALQPSGQSTPYSMTKGALEAMTRSLAIEYAADRVRVNAIRVGHIETGRGVRQLGPDAEAERRLWETYCQILAENAAPWPVAGAPEDFARAVAFLLSEAASYLTGSILALDGGYSVSLRPPHDERRVAAYLKMKEVKSQIENSRSHDAIT
ncbi:MAG TPA: SDR family oxidoreductase [Chthoniobacteraceae bacterium]|nr:SDR family oxidoreductase [Chthoniobacteraceae bacterium]